MMSFVPRRNDDDVWVAMKRDDELLLQGMSMTIFEENGQWRVLVVQINEKTIYFRLSILNSRQNDAILTKSRD